MAVNALFTTDAHLSAADAMRLEHLARSNRVLCAGVVALGATCALLAVLSLYLARKPKVVPFVVELNSAGQVTGLAEPLEGGGDVREAVVRYLLARFISDARSVLADGVAEKAGLHRVYDMARGGAARMLGLYYQQHPPFKLAGKETVQARVDSVLRTPAGAYEVRWTELTRSVSGDVLSATHWRALVGAVLEEPEPSRLFTNPIGLYVTELDWSEVQG